MFAALFARLQEPAAAAVQADPAAFDLDSADVDLDLYDQSLPVPWDWMNDTAAAH